ncbi:2-C-methyl-D-erythritol 2,4-cyclodiphosphate synthase [Rhodobacteraceae bacterium NNCM2]|nr:2-C-methyl-D-erythritol 2,4-cyclodiphosphate synthase [Coraliihabitans acroporae]
MKFAVLIVAAGKGLRLGGPVPKQYQMLGGKMVLSRTLENALASDATLVQVSISPDATALYHSAVEHITDRRLLPPVHGGADRAETVRLALESLVAHDPEVVLVHDAARPFASPTLYNRLAVEAAEEGAIAAEPVVDALWREADGMADVPVPRAGLWRAQTPQAFPFKSLLDANRNADGPPALDDTEVYRNAGLPVKLVPGETDNFKITTAADLDRARAIQRQKETTMDVRVGHGFDVHRFCPGDHVMLCGVSVPHDRGLLGHSDADVGLHSLSDALYGALAEGDIGTHFPPSDPQWKGAESHIFLAHAAELVRKKGGKISNLDVTLLCEKPRIGPHAAAMKARVSEISGVEVGRISIKATTMERMGFVGREEGMGCIATATVILGS